MITHAPPNEHDDTVYIEECACSKCRKGKPETMCGQRHRVGQIAKPGEPVTCMKCKARMARVTIAILGGNG